MAAIRVICDFAGLLRFTNYFRCVASTSCPHPRNPCAVAGMALRGCFMLNEWCIWTGFLYLFLHIFCFFFVQNYNLRVGFRRSSPLSKVDNTENMCIKWMYISNLPREVLWLLIWMRDICLIAFFFRSLFSPKLQVFLRPIGARSTDRLLWTLKRSRDNPSPSFFSLHMNFSTSSLYSVVFVVAFVFSDCLACRGLRFTRKPAKCRICCKQGYLLPCLLYSTHVSFSIVVFDANSCNLHLFFFQSCFLTKNTGCQVNDWSVSSFSAGYIAATQSSCKNC